MLMKLIVESGITPEQIGEAMTLVSSKTPRAALQEQPEAARRMPTWRTSMPYPAEAVVRVRIGAS